MKCAAWNLWLVCIVFGLTFEVTLALFGSYPLCCSLSIFHAYLERIMIFNRLRILTIAAKRVM